MRILIADDHSLIVEGVKLKLAELGDDIEFVVAMSVNELRDLLATGPPPDLALIDLAMPGADGSAHLTETLRAAPDARVVVLSGTQDPALMKELFELGVHGFITKSCSPGVMLSAVRLVLSGGVYVPPMMLHPDEDTTPLAAGICSNVNDEHEQVEARLQMLLTERQLTVLHLLSQGKPNKVIARDLDISEGTVKIHLAAIFRALNVRNRVEAVVASQKVANLHGESSAGR